jgi:amino acid transporter
VSNPRPENRPDHGPLPSSATGVSIAEAEDPNRPKRVMGFRDLLLFYVVTGISLRWIATAAAAGPSAIVIWIGAWLAFYTPLALSVIELSSRYPNELPSSFGALHPRWGTPWVALLTQAVIGAIFIFLGQAGTSVKGAYDVLVSMGVITYFIPYL